MSLGHVVHVNITNCNSCGAIGRVVSVGLVSIGTVTTYYSVLYNITNTWYYLELTVTQQPFPSVKQECTANKRFKTVFSELHG